MNEKGSLNGDTKNRIVSVLSEERVVSAETGSCQQESRNCFVNNFFATKIEVGSDEQKKSSKVKNKKKEKETAFIFWRACALCCQKDSVSTTL